MGDNAILFDLDGTLTDSGEGIMKCAKLALDHYGIPVQNRDALRVFVGPPLAETFIKFGVPPEKTEEAIAIFRSRYLSVGKFENFPYPGISTLLRDLKDRGFRLYVATSKPEPTAVEILEHFGLAAYFEQICGASMGTSRTTKDEVIAYLLEQNGRADHILMVGDTAFDVLGAKAHGIPTIGVAWGYGNVTEMQQAGAVAIAHNMDELFNLLVFYLPSNTERR
ncbi:MAG: HAD-IA family hydrolase [Candidatus Faecousia sp.]|nr:HAD-IA family hydrolase [Candidatus Faecousia sp.]